MALLPEKPGRAYLGNGRGRPGATPGRHLASRTCRVRSPGSPVGRGHRRPRKASASQFGRDAAGQVGFDIHHHLVRYGRCTGGGRRTSTNSNASEFCCTAASLRPVPQSSQAAKASTPSAPRAQSTPRRFAVRAARRRRRPEPLPPHSLQLAATHGEDGCGAEEHEGEQQVGLGVATRLGKSPPATVMTPVTTSVWPALPATMSSPPAGTS